MHSITGRRSRRRVNRVTISDVAAAAGVSAMTVSRVLNGAPGVGSSVRERVEQSISSLRYTRNPAARSLASAEMARIGVLYDRPNGAYLSELLVGLLDEASRSGRQLLLQRCDQPESIARAVETLLEESVDGVVVAPPLSDVAAIYRRLAAAGKPTVAIAAKRDDAGPSVRIDDYAAARRMTEHLIALGHGDIGFVTGDPDLRASAVRERGYRDALSAAGLDAGPIAAGDFSYRSGLEAGALLLARRPRPTAIFASNDDMAAAVSTQAHRRGLDVPGDVAIVGFDDTIIATTTWPELTTIRQPVAELARVAMERLTRRARDPADDGDEIILPYDLVVRASSKALRP